jgi:glucose/arabinose dehydrogenase
MFDRLLAKVRSVDTASLRSRRTGIVLVVALFAVVGLVLIRLSSAATYSVAVEAEAGTPSGAASMQTQDGASGGQTVRFGGSGTGGGPVSTETPNLTATVLLAGLNKPWDLDFLPSGELIFSQRNGPLSVLRGGTATQISGVDDIKTGGEGGMMGVTVDAQFTTNRYIYVCHNSNSGDIKISRYTLGADLTSASGKNDIITGVHAYPTGWHAGCRMDFGPDGNLWIVTGDGATGGTTQDLHELAGKVLHVTRDGAAAPDNLGGGADARVFNYGHRNMQGIAFFPAPKNGVLGLTVEHGPDFDDEINELRKGNFGWGPPAGGYDQGVPMTDKNRFPDAISALWSSGATTQAPSGMTILNGPQWKGWNGAAAVAFLKDKHVTIFHLDAQNKITQEQRIVEGTYGRIRTAHQGPDGSLYLTTDNGNDDKIIKLTPQ